MDIQSADLLHLPVVTVSGQQLGRVSGFAIDPSNHVITSYYVRTGLMKGLWHHELVIAKSQVVLISPERMVVDDNIVPDAAIAPASAVPPVA